MSAFQDAIQKFNAMYKLPVAAFPEVISGTRLKHFKDILREELNEIDEIIHDVDESDSAAADLAALTKLADLLGDIQVYCASEMAKWGLPLDATLKIIMNSNFSKLGADGQPIYDERGKVQKGPGYWKPEPQLQAMLQAQIDTTHD